MAKVEITNSLEKEINKQFKGDSIKVLKHLKSLEENPKKGKMVGVIGEITVKEIKYEGFRFYFLTEGFKLKIMSLEELEELLIKFVRISNKKEQQKTIEEIKQTLLNFGPRGFQ